MPSPFRCCGLSQKSGDVVEASSSSGKVCRMMMLMPFFSVLQTVIAAHNLFPCTHNGEVGKTVEMRLGVF
jgi:hypothetical protein